MGNILKMYNLKHDYPSFFRCSEKMLQYEKEMRINQTNVKTQVEPYFVSITNICFILVNH